MTRFYPIIDYHCHGKVASDLAEELFNAGCTFLQVRAKNITAMEYFRFAKRIIDKAPIDCKVIINDRLDIAMALGAQGVHLGENDIPVCTARKIMPTGTGFIIGATSRNIEQALNVQSQGADYLGVGAVFPTGNKEDTKLIGLEGLAEVTAAVQIPVFAIAGISYSNCDRVIEAGAYGAAGISAWSSGPNPVEQQFRLLDEKLERAARKKS